MSETYFITGAQGCIGSWIVKALTSVATRRWSSIAATTPAGCGAIMSDEDLREVRFIPGDITDGASVLSALNDSSANASFIWPDCKCRRASRSGWGRACERRRHTQRLRSCAKTRLNESFTRVPPRSTE